MRSGVRRPSSSSPPSRSGDPPDVTVRAELIEDGGAADTPEEAGEEQAPEELPLDAPVAAVEPDGTIAWPPVKGAMSYEVKCDSDLPLAADTTVYRGTETRYRPLGLVKKPYRVRAIGGVFRSDSAWSEPVPAGVLSRGSAPWGNYLARLSGAVNAPLLEVDTKNPFATTLRWSYPGLVEKFVLQRADDQFFWSPHTAYEGAAKSWSEFGIGGLLKRYYRVKGVTLLGMETAWSNVAEVG